MVVYFKGKHHHKMYRIFKKMIYSKYTFTYELVSIFISVFLLISCFILYFIKFLTLHLMLKIFGLVLYLIIRIGIYIICIKLLRYRH